MKELNIWRSTFATLLYYALMLLLVYGLSFVLVSSLSRWPSVHQSPWFNTLVNALVSLTFLILTICFVRWYGFKTTIVPKSVKNINWALLIFIFILGLSYFYIDLLFIKGLSLIEIFESPEIKTGNTDFHYSDLPWLTTLVILAPLNEEIFFHGFIMEGMLRKKNNYQALIISSALFALVHYYPGDTINNNVQRIIIVFLFSLCAGAFYWKSRYVIYPIVFHATTNLVSVAAQYVEMPFL
ncbi:MAG: CPBP family intramembrane metalloprotease [Bacteroidetes bacterium]|nr:CPBP family intramembrane metalloprotease [Bacteroidota bacterium]